LSRKNYKPGTEKDKAIVPYEITDFSNAVIRGMAASKIPANSIANANDVVIYPDEIVGREGNSLFTAVTIPALDDRTGYVASKTGKTITAFSSVFTEDDVSNYFVFPGSPETHYEIIEYISDTEVRTFSTGDQAVTSGCYLRGKTNLAQWHKIVKKWVFMWGQQIYVSRWDLTELTRCRVISRDLPNNSVSGHDDFDQFAGIIFNSKGMYRIDLETEIPLVYKLNVPIPNVAIPDIAQTETSAYNYRYLYSASRLFETGNIINRLTPSRIEQETGTNIWDENYRDYSNVYTDRPIGNQDLGISYQILTCASLVSPYDEVTGWNAIPIMGTFYITINGVQKFITVNFFNIFFETMSDVAQKIQDAINVYFPNATCVYDSNGYFVITAGIADGSTIDYIVDGAESLPTYTNIAGFMKGRVGDGAAISTFYELVSRVIGPMYVPNVPNTIPQEYQWHLSHFPVYRTKDLIGRYKIDTEGSEFNSPNDFIWVNDVRVCGAFWGYISTIYYIAEQGEFELADVGSTLELEDGSRYEILEYINSTTVRILSTGLYYGVGSSNMRAAAIGNGRVFRARQAGNLVTRTRGSVFAASDVRKPIKWATGYYSYIIEYVSPTQVRVADSQDKTVMGMTMDPIYRYFNDTISDDDLDSRQTRLKLKQRYWEAMPNGNVGKVTPGLIFTAMRGDGELNYGQIPDTLEYLHGFHDRGYQTTKVIADDIQHMWLFQDIFIIWTSRKTWRWPIAGYDFIVNTFTRDSILQISGLEIVDPDRGCYDWGSIEPIGDGSIMMLVSEPGKISWRRYNGYQYGEDQLVVTGLGKERLPDITKLQQATRAIYDGRAGMLLFGREE
jgi:hypothetical protein